MRKTFTDEVQCIIWPYLRNCKSLPLHIYVRVQPTRTNTTDEMHVVYVYLIYDTQEMFLHVFKLTAISYLLVLLSYLC